MITGPLIILILKIAVFLVTLMFLASIVAIFAGYRTLHGRINLLFFILTLSTVLIFELMVRVIQPDLFQYIKSRPDLNRALNIHLSFAVPSALLLPVMLYSGLRHMRMVHLVVAVAFSLSWLGMFITGIFFLPHN